MKKQQLFLAAILLGLATISCKDVAPEKPADGIEQSSDPDQNNIKSIMTAEEQASMSPDEIIGRLKKGNENFVANNLTTRDHSEQRRLATIGQYPKALVLSCVDSRVPVEDVFDLGIGDIFVARVAGNIENDDILGSMEFATAVAGSKVIIVMGHTSCGAVYNAVDGTDAGAMGMASLQKLLDEIKPVVVAENGVDVSSKNKPYVNKVITENVYKTVADIRLKSPTMKAMEDAGQIKILGAVYHMETGKVEFL
ncbi:carbonic anhydrase family protein [Cellulophaga sp. Hel_I_12]|uniref:carbonic anhydrase family protein n=1 Tax=Cellulophaga sp. Hel_I_12 TaxID=1249972 RepID=UPI0006490380|nr:carbonic anhydrase family protein [Cellulophaga sp. Hel_I_12]